LPVGIKNGAYELIIQQIKYNKETGRSNVYATCAFKFKDSGQRIAFEGSVDIEGQKGLGTSGYLELIAPVSRAIGEQVILLFKNGTRANFNCEGIDSYTAKMDLIVTSEKIIPLDINGAETLNLLSTSIEASFYDFDNYIVSFSFNQPFGFQGLNDLVFTLKGATLDQSDIETSTMIQFPDGYFSETGEEEKNLWKGISISEASVTLPGFFKKPEAMVDSLSTEEESVPGIFSDRITLGLNNVLLDENGFTANASALGILESETLDASQWAVSIDDFLLGIEKDELTEFGFGGDINLPPLGKNSLLPYRAVFNPAIEEYEFQVNVSGEFDFPVLCSTLTLDKTSFLDVLIRDSELYPILSANGAIRIDAPINESESSQRFSLPDISFQNMKISREDPYFEIGAIGITGELTSPEVAGFELSISEIEPFNNSAGSGLGFVAGVKLSDMFSGDAGLSLYGNYSKWNFDRLALDSVKVSYNSNSFSVNGALIFKNGDAMYGTGFGGGVTLSILDQFELDAVSVFGKKDDYRYFLTDVYFDTSPTSGIVVPPALSFYGFGGGLYRRMQQTYDPSITSDFGKSLSGINYIPDSEVGMGFMATTKFGLKTLDQAFNAKVAFEMQFNQYGGLNFVQLRGDASFMNTPDAWGKLADNIEDKVTKLENAGGELKLALKSDLKEPENKSDGFLTASMNVKYDVANKTFSADLNTYLDAGVIKGVGEGNKMGWASAYFSPDKWYTYIGTPSDRMGVDVLGLVTMDGYFMLGDDIPELPLPPQKVLQNFSAGKLAQLNRRDASELTAGSGIAFGQSSDIDFNATLPPFYASLGVGMGSEFLLKNYGADAYCAGGNTTLGINGWYARAQAWAWIEAAIGIKAKVFGSTRKFEILDLSASSLLTGAGPNPFYFTGAVGGRFSVMGGLVSGKCDFDFEIGEECKIMGASPFVEDVIAQLTPATGESDVNVFSAPQAVFNIPIGLEMKVEEAEGLYAWYKVTLEEFSVSYKDTQQKLEGLTQLSEDGKIYMLDPNEPFESEKEMIVQAKVGFMRKLNGVWTAVKGEDGYPLLETKTGEFVSGERPEYILPEHVKYSYPIVRQYNFYPMEYDKGYIAVTENYAYLFSTDVPEGYNQVLRFSYIDDKSTETDFSYTTATAGNEVRLEINYSLTNVDFVNDEIYKMAIVNVPQSRSADISSNVTATETSLNGSDSISVTKSQAEGTLEMLEEKNIYSLTFRTSAYNTFVDKMKGVAMKSVGTWQESPHIDRLISNLLDQSSSTEIFDVNEANTLNVEASLVQVTPVYDQTTWYKKEVAPLIYENDDVLEAAKMLGLSAPVESGVVKMLFQNTGHQLNDDMINTNTRANLYPLGSFQYHAATYVNRDFVAVRNALANSIISSGDTRNKIAAFLSEDHIPDIIDGDYVVKLDYVLPGKNIKTSSVNKTIVLED
jgi:hypothetical protein